MARPEHKINALKRVYLSVNNPDKDKLIDKCISDLNSLPSNMDGGIGGEI